MFEVMKKINVNGEDFIVSFIKRNSFYHEWYCAYVYFENIKLEDKYSYIHLHNCTFNDKNVFGIDTDHWRNHNMTLEEKYIDAKHQIIELIKDLMKKVKEDE